MHELYELKEMLCKELEEYGSKGEMSTGSLEVVDKLAHAIKNIGKIIEMKEEEDGYSGNYAYRYDNGGDYRMNRTSYARGRGRNARRDSMGRYSRDEGVEEMVDSIRSMMDELPQEVQKDAQRFVEKLEQHM